MNDQEKFDGFMQKLVDDNERQYGEEIRVKYGDDVVDRSNTKIKGMSEEQYAEAEKLRIEVNKTLKAAFAQGDPASELAQKACELHKKWLCNYDKIADGCAAFLRDAVSIYCK